jgi:hypothetical protein
MKPPLVRTECHHALLNAAARGFVSRRQGTVWIDGAPGNLAQQVGVSALDEHDLLWWWPPRGDTQDCCLSPLGDAMLQKWELELWGPPDHPMVSRRDLTCLDDVPFPLTDHDARLLTHAAFEVTAEDIETDQP